MNTRAFVCLLIVVERRRLVNRKHRNNEQQSDESTVNSSSDASTQLIVDWFNCRSRLSINDRHSVDSSDENRCSFSSLNVDFFSCSLGFRSDQYVYFASLRFLIPLLPFIVPPDDTNVSDRQRRRRRQRRLSLPFSLLLSSACFFRRSVEQELIKRNSLTFSTYLLLLVFSSILMVLARLLSFVRFFFCLRNRNSL
jgi:hypothetical protein